MARRFAAADPAGKSPLRRAFENKPVPKLPVGKRRQAKGRMRSRPKSRY